MATPLTKTVERLTDIVRDEREVLVSLEPGDKLAFRLKGLGSARTLRADLYKILDGLMECDDPEIPADTEKLSREGMSGWTDLAETISLQRLEVQVMIDAELTTAERSHLFRIVRQIRQEND